MAECFVSKYFFFFSLFNNVRLNIIVTYKKILILLEAFGILYRLLFRAPSFVYMIIKRET